MKKTGAVEIGYDQPLDYLESSLSLARSQVAYLCAKQSDLEARRLLAWIDGACRSTTRLARGVNRALLPRESMIERAIDLRGVLTRSVSMLEPELERRARLECELSYAPLVQGNELRLVQVFLNLLANAALAIPEGQPEAHSIRVLLYEQPKGHPVVEVCDTGPPLWSQHLATVTEPYFTPASSGAPLGFGLAVCKRIVAAAGGRLEIAQGSTCGTCVRVILPVADAP
jgi:C4-dicarboxylate-specific signal transduction histidine kinase